ncbi:aldehyde dehydrogenase family protein [Salinibacterium sp. dk2585]|uniref:aldehyde dehydrogenase family protein n=1 Tax=unclassified Salinibacterium TaxID=2632331 RepID=UPI0011C25481|nr:MULTISPECIES: aldehyde dehydrogenase family protein [unclassified Salinibacterium]QEE61428.1 aldehyde dehydrogenase family protein [Salinibacterium sp. dk2585]TXK54105.1 aldehyde dehydrogenase family protein [Salinibacterium sp. dk5596]
MTAVYEVIDPATLEVIGVAPDHSEADVAAAVDRAIRAERSWASDREQRRGALRAIAGSIRADEERLARLLSLEQGKVMADAVGEFRVAAGLFDYYAELDWPEVETLPDRADRSLEVHNRPVGVVGTITPWNFPISLLCVKLAPALVAGCTVIAKPSATTPLSTIALVELAARVLPEGVLQASTSRGRAVNVALSTLPGVRKISFTGSTEVGSAIAQQAAATVKRVTLELGGNDPAIVLDDAHIETTARGIVGSAFRNSGQVCMAVKRVYAPRNRVDELIDAIAAAAAAHVLGHGVAEGTTMGPMHNRSQLDIVSGLIIDAEASGARVVTGGARGCELPGHFLQPTVIANAEPGMRIVEEEQFGNALPIVAYDELETTLELVNAGEFGLGASVWSPDLERAHTIASRIDAGTVWINQHTLVEVDAPFGGWKASGIGRERGRWGLSEYLQTRTLNARPHG